LFVGFEGEFHVKGKYKYYPMEDDAYGGLVHVFYEADEAFPGNYISDTYQTDRPDRKLQLEFDGVWGDLAFGNPGTEGEVELGVRDYKFKYTQSEVIDTAELVEIISITNNIKTVADVDPASIQWVEFVEGKDSDVGNLVEEYYRDYLLETEGPETNLYYSIAEEDLNGDNKPEIIAAIHNSSFVGASCNSSLVVFSYREGKIGEEINLVCTTIYTLDDRPTFGIIDRAEPGWKDIIIENNQVWTWNGSGYGTARIERQVST
jgi:hypothetical protein